MQLIASIGGSDQIGRRLRLPDQELEHGQRCLVRPMQVFDNEDRRSRASILPKQAEKRAEETVSIRRLLPRRGALGCQCQQLGDHALQPGLAIRLPDDAADDRHEGLVRWWRFRKPARPVEQRGYRSEQRLAKQARLADAGIAGDHHRASGCPHPALPRRGRVERKCGHTGPQECELVVAPNQWRPGCLKSRRLRTRNQAAFDQRRAIGRRHVAPDNLIKTNRLREALQCDRPPVAHRKGSAGANQGPHHVRDQQLAGAGRGADPRRHVDGRPDEVVVLRHRFSGVQSDADSHREVGLSLGADGGVAEDRGATGNRLTGRRKDHEHRIALDLDLGPARFANALTDQRSIGSHEIGGDPVAVPLDEGRVIPEIGEEESPGAFCYRAPRRGCQRVHLTSHRRRT